MSKVTNIPAPPTGYKFLATATKAQREAAMPKRKSDLFHCKYAGRWMPLIADGSEFYDTDFYARRVPKRKKAGAK